MSSAAQSGRLGAVVAGTSFGVLTCVPALRLAGFEVRALVGTNPERTARRAGYHGIPHATTLLAEALELPGVDAVVVATPPHTHAAIVGEALAAGKHVVCEKPFAANATEAAQMRDAAERAGVVALVGHELRWFPGYALLEEIVRGGLIGEPRLATAILLVPGLESPESDAPEWWTDAASGGGWLGAHASHAVDQLRAILGEFASVSGGVNVISDHAWSAEDSYTVHFRTVGGAEGVMQGSYATYGPVASMMRVSGSEGTAWIEGDPLAATSTAWIADRNGQRALEIPERLRFEAAAPLPAELIADLDTKYARNHASGRTIPPYAKLAETFRDLILGRPVPDVPRPPTFADGYAHMLVLDAIRRASAGEGWVSVG